MQRNVLRHRVISAVLTLAMVAGLLLSALPALSVKVLAVSNAEELRSAIENAEGDITLNSDIAMPSDWTPIDFPQGVILHGNGHMITGLKTTLFDTVYGAVFGIGVVLDTGASSDTSAILAKTLAGSGNIGTSFVYGSLNYNGTDPVGGLVGRSIGAIEDCFSLVTIHCTSDTYVGGLVGLVENGSGVKHCYSAGSVKADNGTVAGLANIADGATPTVSDTYTSCQLRTVNSRALPSGVDDLYDNQLSLVRESSENEGLDTKALMATTALSDSFVVTSTAYPALKVFYTSGWGEEAQAIIRASIAAAAFSDVTPSNRLEPSERFVARADYLTHDTYVDRTNAAELSWSMSSDVCKLYDTVPQTSMSTPGSYVTGSSADLLRARLMFSANDTDAEMTVSSGSYSRTWYLRAADANPYFNGGSGKEENSPLTVISAQQLDHVRYYTRIDEAYYAVGTDIDVGTFDPIIDFRGDFDGNNKTLSKAVLNTSYTDAVGLFANVKAGTTIHNVILDEVTLSSEGSANPYVGALIGQSVGTDTERVTIDKVVLCDSNTKLVNSGTVGGLVGQALHTDLANILVSAEIQGSDASGGIVGTMSNSTLVNSGVTGLVTGFSSIGGIVGTIPVSSTVRDCYSTAAVISKSVPSGTYIGGLVGNNAAGVISSCYVAGAIDANGTPGVFVGSESSASVGDACFYDSNITIVGGISGQQLTTETMLGDTAMADLSAEIWTKTADHYPQLAFFSSNVSAGLMDLSALSTVPMVFQQYWHDDGAVDMTTGWMPKSFRNGSADNFTEPTLVDGTLVKLTDSGVVNDKVYEVDDGWGFEAASSCSRIELRFEDVNAIGMRTAVGVRNGLISLSYTVGGVENVNTYVKLYYSTDGENWQGSQVMSISGNDAVCRLYDMPRGALVRVSVQTEDEYAVDTITIGTEELTDSDHDGYYESAAGFSTDTIVEIVLKEADPAWGLRKESY